MAYLGREAAKAALVTADIPDDSITSAKIVDATVAAGDLAANSVDSSELVDGSVDLSHMSSESVDEDNLHVSNSPTDGHVLTARSSAAGDMTWEAAGGGGKIVKVSTHITTNTATISASGSNEAYEDNAYDMHVTCTAGNRLHIWILGGMFYGGTPTGEASYACGLRIVDSGNTDRFFGHLYGHAAFEKSIATVMYTHTAVTTTVIIKRAVKAYAAFPTYWENNQRYNGVQYIVLEEEV